MSAQPSSPLHGMRLQAMQPADLAEVLAIEEQVYPFPWTLGNFKDSLNSGYSASVLRARDGSLVGYMVLMKVVDEVHLLNISVRGDLHGQGIGRYLLDCAADAARSDGMLSILLEVRPSNVRALAVYEKYGFVTIGRRKAYYPAGGQEREDAIVMRVAV